MQALSTDRRTESFREEEQGTLTACAVATDVPGRRRAGEVARWAIVEPASNVTPPAAGTPPDS